MPGDPETVRILLIQLEFPTWQKARHWSYSAQLGLEEGFQANGVEFFTLPALWGRSTSATNSWLGHARELCAGKHFDQVWMEMIHSNLEERLLEWLASLAPMRIGFLPESLEYDPGEYIAFPYLKERQVPFAQRLKYLTHVLTIDERDAENLKVRAGVRAMWCPAAIPARFICEQIPPAGKRKAIFYGALYGPRAAWLEHADLKNLLIHPLPPEDATPYPKLFDQLHQSADSYGRIEQAGGKESALAAYLEAVRKIRRKVFSLWIQSLQEGCAVVNLPHLVKSYAGRVVETMAAGRPAISWEIPNRPRNKALFADGKEILLFSQNDPRLLAGQIENILSDPDFGQGIAQRAREKIRQFHTVEKRVRQILAWVEKGMEPDYGEPVSARKDTLTSQLSCPSQNTLVPKDRNFFIKPGYFPRPQPEYFRDVSDETITYQPDVYLIASFLGKQLGCSHILDMGCGRAQKLVSLYPEFQIMGIDFGPNIRFCQQSYPAGRWIELDLETAEAIPIDNEVIKKTIIVCSDVIEHLKDPLPLLRNIRNLLQHAPLAILTTPERDLTRGRNDFGPPSNPCHVREWNLKELELFLQAQNLRTLFAGLTRSNDQEDENRTSLVILGNNDPTPNPVFSEAMQTVIAKWLGEPAHRRGSPSPTKVMMNQASFSFPSASQAFRVVAILAAYNEGDVIYHVIGELIENGVEVYLIDNNSTDNTVAEARRWRGKGLISIERFPQDSGYPERCVREYVWSDLLKRKEELAEQLNGDWYIHADADEFRESPWPEMNLSEAIRWVDSLGYNAIHFELLNFRPTDDGFIPGSDVRKHLTFWEPGDWFDAVQIKAWKNAGRPIHLAQSGGHGVEFPGRRICPVPFLLRHYPIRGETHGRQKVFKERLPRFAPEEKATGWHVQYNSFQNGEVRFIRDPSTLIPYDPHAVRSAILSRLLNEVLLVTNLHDPGWISSPLNGPAVSAWLGRTLGAPPLPLPEVRKADETLNTLLREGAKKNWQFNIPADMDAAAVALLKAAAKIKAAVADLEGKHVWAKRWADLSAHLLPPQTDKAVPCTGQQSSHRKGTVDLSSLPPQHYCPLKKNELSVSHGEELFGHGDLEGAKAVFHQITQRDSKNVEALNNLGVIVFQQGKVDEALSYFRRVLEIDPGHFESIDNIGKCMMAQQQFTGAMECFTRGLKLKPEDPSIRNALAICHGQIEHLKNAEKDDLQLSPFPESQKVLEKTLAEGEGIKALEVERRIIP